MALEQIRGINFINNKQDRSEGSMSPAASQFQMDEQTTNQFLTDKQKNEWTDSP